MFQNKYIVYKTGVTRIKHFQKNMEEENVFEPKFPFSWATFMSELLEDIHPISLEDEVTIHNINFFRNIQVLLTKTSPQDLGRPVIKLALTWRNPKMKQQINNGVQFVHEAKQQIWTQLLQNEEF